MKPQYFWIGLVVALLSMTVLTYGVGMIIAINDPSFALEEDYEQKAADWDEIQQQRLESKQLGWTADLSVRPGRIRGEAEVTLELYDKYGKVVRGAIVEIECFHNARASDVHRARLDIVGDRYYGKTMMLRRPGIWEFRLRAVAGEDVYVRTMRKSVSVAR